MSSESMLTNTIVYMAAAVVAVPIASRLKLGSVLGYLGAGCAIGPFGLRLVGDSEGTLHIAEIGVVLMLLVIGLELDPRKLWAMRRSVFGGGGLQLGAAALVAGDHRPGRVAPLRRPPGGHRRPRPHRRGGRHARVTATLAR